MLKSLTELNVVKGDKVQFVSPYTGRPGDIRTIGRVANGRFFSAGHPARSLVDAAYWRLIERKGAGDLDRVKELFSRIDALVKQAGYKGVVDVRILGDGGVTASWSGAVIEIKQNWGGK